MQFHNFVVKDIFKEHNFTADEIKIIESVFHKTTVKKGTILLHAGDAVENIYYIYDGCLRTFLIDKHGKEHTMRFAIKNSWITDSTAFFSGSNALLNIEVLQNATVYKLSRKDKDYLISQFPRLQAFISKNQELAYAIMQNRIIANLSQTATEQYLNFIKSYPDIERNVKNYHIASYLGITTESLSRIRKDLLL